MVIKTNIFLHNSAIGVTQANQDYESVKKLVASIESELTTVLQKHTDNIESETAATSELSLLKTKKAEIEAQIAIFETKKKSITDKIAAISNSVPTAALILSAKLAVDSTAVAMKAEETALTGNDLKLGLASTRLKELEKTREELRFKTSLNIQDIETANDVINDSTLASSCTAITGYVNAYNAHAAALADQQLLEPPCKREMNDIIVTAQNSQLNTTNAELNSHRSELSNIDSQVIAGNETLATAKQGKAVHKANKDNLEKQLAVVKNESKYSDDRRELESIVATQSMYNLHRESCNQQGITLAEHYASYGLALQLGLKRGDVRNSGDLCPKHSDVSLFECCLSHAKNDEYNVQLTKDINTEKDKYAQQLAIVTSSYKVWKDSLIFSLTAVVVARVIAKAAVDAKVEADADAAVDVAVDATAAVAAAVAVDAAVDADVDAAVDADADAAVTAAVTADVAVAADAAAAVAVTVTAAAAVTVDADAAANQDNIAEKTNGIMRLLKTIISLLGMSIPGSSIPRTMSAHMIELCNIDTALKYVIRGITELLKLIPKQKQGKKTNSSRR